MKKAGVSIAPRVRPEASRAGHVAGARKAGVHRAHAGPRVGPPANQARRGNHLRPDGRLLPRAHAGVHHARPRTVGGTDGPLLEVSHKAAACDAIARMGNQVFGGVPFAEVAKAGSDGVDGGQRRPARLDHQGGLDVPGTRCGPVRPARGPTQPDHRGPQRLPHHPRDQARRRRSSGRSSRRRSTSRRRSSNSVRRSSSASTWRNWRPERPSGRFSTTKPQPATGQPPRSSRCGGRVLLQSRCVTAAELEVGVRLRSAHLAPGECHYACRPLLPAANPL